jgi:crooked neck
MEEVLVNIAGARQVFERWMEWMPAEQGWLAFIKFEMRYNEIERSRAIYERCTNLGFSEFVLSLMMLFP